MNKFSPSGKGCYWLWGMGRKGGNHFLMSVTSFLSTYNSLVWRCFFINVTSFLNIFICCAFKNC